MDWEQLATKCRDVGFRKELETTLTIWIDCSKDLGTLIQTLRMVFNDTNITSDLINVLNKKDNVDEDDGLSYSYTISQPETIQMDTNIELISNVDVIHDIKTAIQLITKITSCFRFLRNSCASSHENQNKCRETGFLDQAYYISQVIRQYINHDNETLKELIILLGQVHLQFVVNAVAQNSLNQQEVWRLYFPDEFQKLLVECHDKRKIIAFTVAILLNCVNSDESSRLTELIEHRNIVATLLQRCLQITKSSAPDQVRSSIIEDDDPAFEWLCILFRLFFSKRKTLETAYAAVGAHMLSRLWSQVTPEQLIFLRMLNMFVAQSTKVMSKNNSKVWNDSHSFNYTELYAFLHNLCTSLLTENQGVSKISEIDNEWVNDASRVKMWQVLEGEAKVLILDMLGGLSTIFNDNNKSDFHIDAQHLTSTEDNERLLVALLQELQSIWSLNGQAAQSHKARDNILSNISDQREATEPFGYRCGIIRVVGNLCFRHKKHQDIVREQGYLPLFLIHCNIDPHNPLVREWSLVALRHLCEGNQENQQYINALRPQANN